MTTHECPAPECRVRVNDNALMCYWHWFLVPGQIRSAVWTTWRNGRGVGSQEHRLAMQQAIESVSSHPYER